MVDSGDIRNTLYPDWVDKNFGSEAAVVALYNHMVKAGWYTKDVKSFFAKFACDLYSNGQYCQGVTQNTTSTNTTTTNTQTVDDSSINAIFSCVYGSQILKGMTKSLNGSNTIVYKLSTGGQLEFNIDKSFVYVSRNDPNRKVKGTWECNGEKDFIVNTENNARLDSKLGYWEYDVIHKSTASETNTKTPAGNTNDSSVRIKMGDKGDKVKEVQNLLIKNGFKNVSKNGTADGVFGSRTLGAVKDFQSANKDKKGSPLVVDGIVGANTMEALKRKNLQENIIKKVLKRNLEMKNK